MPNINVGEENNSPIDIHYNDVGVGRPSRTDPRLPSQRPLVGESRSRRC